MLTSGGTKFGIFSDSYSGRLYINADYIRSGTINADYIDLSCDYGGFCKGHGSDGQHTTYGAMMYGSNGPGWEPYIIVTNAGARISGSGADLVVSGSITMSEEPSYGSDLRILNGLAWVWCSYILALLGREQIAEALSQVALKEIIGVVLIYGLKALFENLSKNNSWPDKGNSTPPEDGVG